MENQDTLKPGMQSEAKKIVEFGDTAKAISLEEGDDFPEVYATTSMIGLMELAGARAIVPLLKAHQLSVGVGVDIKHLAATPVGVEVKAIATFLEMEGNLFKFKVEAFDPGGLIGKGIHTRAIIDTERLIAGAKSKL